MSDPTRDPIEPAGSEGDRQEQDRDAGPVDRPSTFTVPDDPEVPLADAWEGAQPASVGDEDERR